MAFAQLAQALEHQLRIGLGGAEAVAGLDRAADHLARQMGDGFEQAFGVMAIDPGAALGEADQGLVERVELLAQGLGGGQGQRGHHAVGLDLQQASDHSALAVGIEPAVDEQEAVGAVFGETKVAPHHGIATADAGAAGVLEAVVRQVEFLLVTHQYLHGVDHLRCLRGDGFGQYRRQRLPLGVGGGAGHQQGQGEELGVPFPLERMAMQTGDALGRLRVEGLWAAALQQGRAGRIAAEHGQVEDVGRAVEIQRRTGVQFVVQGGALRVHGWSGLVL
ncbi:hypothetical protein D3C79_557880 [compost metagenome]